MSLAQIFRPSADTWLRLLVAFAVVLLGAAVLVSEGYASSDYQTGVGWAPQQPVPFSHKHHVGDLGLDCRYCHSNVEKGADAGLPSTHVCMTCHSQLWTQAAVLAPVRQSYVDNRPIAWQRVAQLPDYVYFNHSIHVSRGVPCVACHGRIDRMPLTFRAKAFQMKFCLDCHRDPAREVRPPNQVTRMDWSSWTAADQKKYGAFAVRHFGIDPARLQNCETCHR